MTAGKSVKTRRGRCRIVGVITTASELRSARRMSHPPDLFELRLDYLVAIENRLESEITRLRAPLIITARHPAEGGTNNLSLKRRRELLWRFLPRARYVDVELRSVRAFQALLDTARRRGVGRIISFHALDSTPSLRSLHAKARAAQSHRADIFKLATRIDTPAQLVELLNFASNKPYPPLSVMGLGKFGGISRVAFARSGSVLIYAALEQKRLEGQLSLDQLRAAFDIFDIR
jgi:3-dehydroquinate dehydratase-1